MLADVLAGLGRRPRRLSSKYFYDARGSALFEEITRLPEYYLTRVELDLMHDSLRGIAAHVGPRAHVVELGTGSGKKTRILLEGLDSPVAYTAVEISRDALIDAAGALAREFPTVEMLPVCADFSVPVSLPRPRERSARTLAFLPGSTLGNFEDDQAIGLLRALRETMGRDGLGLIGLDQVKDPAVIEAAYNDTAGVTAAFTLNLLERFNRELGSDFDLDAFAHRAVYVPERQRIETSLVSLHEQQVTVAGRVFHFAAGEETRVEISRKYTDEGFHRLAREAGLRVVDAWKDASHWFRLALVAPGTSSAH